MYEIVTNYYDNHRLHNSSRQLLKTTLKGKKKGKTTGLRGNAYQSGLLAVFGRRDSTQLRPISKAIIGLSVLRGFIYV